MNDDAQCPVCGYYCLGKGGLGCIDKSSSVNQKLVPSAFNENIPTIPDHIPDTSKMIAEAIAKLKEQQSNTDLEMAHGVADDVLCDLLEKLGYGDVVDEYSKVDKWYA